MRTPILAGMLLLAAGPLPAQEVISARAGTVLFATSTVSINSQPLQPKRFSYPVLRDGDVLRTGRGRAEVLLAQAVFLRMGPGSSITMDDTRLDHTRLTLGEGPVLVEVVKKPPADDGIQIRMGEALARLKDPGLYRFEGVSELRVFGGDAEVSEDSQTVKAGSGKVIQIGAGMAVSKFDRKQADALHRWAAARSYRIFMSDLPAHRSWFNWEMTISGWVYNRDFGMKFFSSAVQRALSAKAFDAAGRR